MKLGSRLPGCARHPNQSDGIHGAAAHPRWRNRLLSAVAYVLKNGTWDWEHCLERINAHERCTAVTHRERVDARCCPHFHLPQPGRSEHFDPAPDAGEEMLRGGSALASAPHPNSLPRNKRGVTNSPPPRWGSSIDGGCPILGLLIGRYRGMTMIQKPYSLNMFELEERQDHTHS